jgi:hypothetical protein
MSIDEAVGGPDFQSFRDCLVQREQVVAANRTAMRWKITVLVLVFVLAGNGSAVLSDAVSDLSQVKSNHTAARTYDATERKAAANKSFLRANQYIHADVSQGGGQRHHFAQVGALDGSKATPVAI